MTAHEFGPSRTSFELATDPATPLEMLAELAFREPELRPVVAANPAAYAGLLRWLADLEDPIVDAAIRTRPDHPVPVGAAGGGVSVEDSTSAAPDQVQPSTRRPAQETDGVPWNVFAILGPGEGSGGFYPLVSDQLTVTPELLDGPMPTKIDLGILEVERQGPAGLTKVSSVSEVKLEIYPTASRLIVYCKKWTKGGFVGSTGGLGLAIALTTAVASSAHAARKRKDKVLAGHIRWEWVSAIGWRARSFWQRNEVVIKYVDATSGAPTLCHLVLAFRPGINSQALAREMTDKVITYRHASAETFDHEELSKWESLRASGMSPKVDKGISWLTMPSFWEVGQPGFPGATPDAKA